MTGGACAGFTGGSRLGSTAGGAARSIVVFVLGNMGWGLGLLLCGMAEVLADFSSELRLAAAAWSLGGMPSGPITGALVWK